MLMSVDASTNWPGLGATAPPTMTVPRSIASRARERDFVEAPGNEKLVEPEAVGWGNCRHGLHWRRTGDKASVQKVLTGLMGRSMARSMPSGNRSSATMRRRRRLWRP